MSLVSQQSALRRRLVAAAPSDRWVRWVLWALAAGLLFELVEAVFVPGLLDARADLVLYLVLMGTGSALAIARAVARRPERAAWSVIGLALASTMVAEISLAVRFPDGDAPYPSIADVFYLVSYPLMGAGIVLLVRARLTSQSRSLWLDGMAAGFAAGAVAATVLAPAIADATSGSRVEVLTNLAYPVGDLVMVFMTALGLALTGWRPDPALIAVAAANVVTFAADAVYLIQVSGGGYTPGTALDVLWPLGVACWAFAAWQRPGARLAPVLKSRMSAAPVACATLALAVLCWFVISPDGPLDAALAIAAIVLVVARFTLTQHESIRLLERARTDSLVDPLTGLGNRRALWLYLDERAGTQTAVAVLDLDGFKGFNDAFGHAAGDALLVATSERLQTAAPRARVFRLGGDEFCIVGGVEVQVLRPFTIDVAGLDDRSRVTASIGVATMPHDTDDPDTAMRLADERMYASKLAGRRPLREVFEMPVGTSDAGRSTVRA